MSEELKACPFCDGRAASQTYGNRSGGASYAIWCDTCHVSTAWTADRGAAISDWNRRVATPPAVPAPTAQAELPPLPQPMRIEFERPHGLSQLKYYNDHQMNVHARAAYAMGRAEAVRDIDAVVSGLNDLLWGAQERIGQLEATARQAPPSEDAPDAARFAAAIALDDNAEALYAAVRNHAPDGDAIRREFDAAIKSPATEPKEG